MNPHKNFTHVLVYTINNSSLYLGKVPEMMVTEWKVFFNPYSFYSQNQQKLYAAPGFRGKFQPYILSPMYQC